MKHLQRKATKMNSWKLGPWKGDVYGFIWPGESRTRKWPVGGSFTHKALLQEQATVGAQ